MKEEFTTKAILQARQGLQSTEVDQLSWEECSYWNYAWSNSSQGITWASNLQVSEEIIWCRHAFDQFSVRKLCSAADFFKTCQRLDLDIWTIAVTDREVLIFQMEDWY